MNKQKIIGNIFRLKDRKINLGLLVIAVLITHLFNIKYYEDYKTITKRLILYNKVKVTLSSLSSKNTNDIKLKIHICNIKILQKLQSCYRKMNFI